MPAFSANRSRPHRMGVPAQHEQPYSQVVLKIRSVTGEASRIGHFASLENTRLAGSINCTGNRKGCDIGYVPASCSCERAYSVDPCTAAALVAIAAFAVTNPGSSTHRQALPGSAVRRWWRENKVSRSQELRTFPSGRRGQPLKRACSKTDGHL